MAVEPLQGCLWLELVNKSILVIRWVFEGVSMISRWFHRSCQEDYRGTAELGGRKNRLTSLVLSNSGDSSGQPLEALGPGEDDWTGRVSAW